MMKSKVALVTGASSGIGQATAQRLAHAGYQVYGTSRRAGQAGSQPFAMLALDVTSDESVEATVQELIHTEGRIDRLMNTPVSVLPLPPRKRARSSRPARSLTPTSSVSFG